MKRLLIAICLLIALGGTSLAGPSGTSFAHADDATPAIAGSPETGTPVASRGGVQLLYLHWFENGDSTHVRGELLNTTDQTVRAPTVWVLLIGDDGKAFSSIQLSPPVTFIDSPVFVLEPGERLGLAGHTDIPLGGWKREEVEMDDGGPASADDIAAQPTGLIVQALNEHQESDRKMTAYGEVRNGGPRAVGSVEVRVLYYLTDGRYAGSSATVVYPGTLAPSDTGSFGVAVNLAPGLTHRLVAAGLSRAEMPPDAGQGKLEMASDGSYAGTPRIARTGVELSYLYPRKLSDGSMAFFGELRNTTEQTIEAPAIAITFYDAAGKIVDSRRADAVLRFVPPQGSTPFEVWTALDDGAWGRFSFVLGVAKPVDPVLAGQGLAMERIDEVEKSARRLVVTGDVVNRLDHATTDIDVYALIYDAAGHYAGYGATYVLPSSYDGSYQVVWAPGDRGAFKLKVDVDAGSGWTYRVVVGHSSKMLPGWG